MLTPDEAELEDAWGVPVAILPGGPRRLAVIRDADAGGLFARPYAEVERRRPGFILTRREAPAVLSQDYPADVVSFALALIDGRLASPRDPFLVRVRNEMRRRGLTQVALALALRENPVLLSQMLTGRRPAHRIRRAVAKHLAG